MKKSDYEKLKDVYDFGEITNRISVDKYSDNLSIMPREYYYYDGYGNLVSSDDKDYSNYLDDYFIDSLLENHSDLSLDADIETLLDELENAE